MNRPSEPFNAEERELAQRLARLGGPREPAAALDAVILAAARAAVSEPAAAVETPAGTDAGTPAADPKVTPLRPRKPAPRWPLGFGLAASVVLAAGIGWRMQIDTDSRSEAASAPSAVFDEEATEAVILEPPLQRMPPPAPPPLETSDEYATRANQIPAPAAKAVAASPAPEFAASADMEEGLVAAQASPPPAPATPAAAAADAAADASLDKVTVTGSRVSSPERAVGAAEYTRTPLHERREQAAQEPKSAVPAGAAAPAPATSTRARGFVADAPPPAEAERDSYDDRPPVSADSPEFRQAWLQRIRALIAKGDTDAARDSLQEFRRRYPDVELPEDLRKLAATLPTP